MRRIRRGNFCNTPAATRLPGVSYSLVAGNVDKPGRRQGVRRRASVRRTDNAVAEWRQRGLFRELTLR